MKEGDTLTVEIDRISNAGNHIAEIPNGGHLIVYGATVGDTVRVRVERSSATLVGQIKDPTPEQEERAKCHQMEHKGYAKQRDKKRAEQRLRAQAERRRKNSTSDENKEEDRETAREESKGPNKNSLITGNL